jgi:hypothetical protein
MGAIPVYLIKKKLMVILIHGGYLRIIFTILTMDFKKKYEKKTQQ